MTMSEIDEAASIIAKTVDPDADIIFGAVIDEKMLDQIKITLVATKFDSQKLKLFQLRKKSLTENFNQSPPTQQIINDVKKLQESAEVIDIATETDFNEKDNILDEFDDDSEFDVPAFLRKK
jgi:cell division protein FtsZ